MSPGSDIDIRVELEPGGRNGPIKFASFAGRGVDLFTERGLKPGRQSTLAGVEAHLEGKARSPPIRSIPGDAPNGSRTAHGINRN